jgi:protein-arginine kinase
MDKIIEKYHGHSPSAKHISSMDYKQLNCPPFPADEDKMINSTRIRVARNLAAYPLGTAVTRAERLEIEKLVTSALSEFTGDLAGKYYSLTKMSAGEKKQLIADHFLFKGGDKYLESCGLERDWPEARGIYHNNNKTFLVWVNEEDQLRIISMQPGSNILEVFKRLSIAAGKIEEKAKFANDEHLGYISNCPTNLGTGLRASVHINLPKLMRNKQLH